MRLMVSVSCLSFSFFLAGCDFDFGDYGDSHRYQENFSHTYELKPGGRLSVENFNGGVEIFGWDKNTVEVSGTKYAASEDLLRSIRVDIQATPDAVRIRTEKPAARGNYGARFTIHAPRKCELDRIGSSNGSVRVEDIDAPVRLRTSNGSVRVLRIGGALDAQTTNGSLELRELHGGATLRTSNGAIRAEDLRGSVEASTSNGGITVTLDELHDVRASTSNGAITVRMPEPAGAQVQASTSNSSIHSDFDVRGRITKNRVSGTIGSGGPLLDLETTNGSIRLLRR